MSKKDNPTSPISSAKAAEIKEASKGKNPTSPISSAKDSEIMEATKGKKTKSPASPISSAKATEIKEASKGKSPTSPISSAKASEIMEASKGKSMKRLAKKLAIALLGLLMILVACAVGLYFHSPLGKYTRPVFKSVPFPVAIVGEARAVISSRELIRSTDAVRKFYESQDFTDEGLRIDFGTEQGKMRLKVKEKEVLDKLIEGKIIEQLANERGIYVTKAEAQERILNAASEYGDPHSLELSLGSLYGWDIGEFRDNVVVQQLYLKRLFAAYALEVAEQEGYRKIMEAKAELNDDGSNFAEMVRKYSEGESAESGGELGWFRYQQLIGEVSEAVFAMEPGQISEVIISPVGFHIVQLEEMREVDAINPDLEAGEGEKTQKVKEAKIRQIYVHGKTFLDWLIEEKKKTKVLVLMKDYRWDANTGFVQFRDEAMRNMEEEIRMKSTGDPSIRSGN